MSVDLDLCYMPATEIAGRIRAGSLTATRVVENSLARIAAVNPKLNAFCFVYPDEALAIAARLDREARDGKFRGPLHGVPFAIKDLTPTKGKRTTRGSYAYEHWVPDHDAPIVEALNAAGGVMVGKTTTPEFAYSGFTESRSGASRAIPGIRIALPAVHRAVPASRWPAAACRSRKAPTWAAPSAFRPPSVAWSA
jgi:Asp-tRNA(Asn)/Glu-tRNA(Gln) amidotransferase A subunit family amidase